MFVYIDTFVCLYRYFMRRVSLIGEVMCFGHKDCKFKSYTRFFYFYNMSRFNYHFLMYDKFYIILSYNVDAEYAHQSYNYILRQKLT